MKIFVFFWAFCNNLIYSIYKNGEINWSFHRVIMLAKIILQVHNLFFTLNCFYWISCLPLPETHEYIVIGCSTNLSFSFISFSLISSVTTIIHYLIHSTGKSGIIIKWIYEDSARSRKTDFWDWSLFEHIYNRSLGNGTAQDEWRKTNIMPIFQKGDKTRASNYPLVSLTFVASKIHEHVEVSSIIKHADDYKILSKYQHRFCAKHSYETQVLLTGKTWLMHTIQTQNCNGSGSVPYV